MYQNLVQKAKRIGAKTNKKWKMMKIFYLYWCKKTWILVQKENFYVNMFETVCATLFYNRVPNFKIGHPVSTQIQNGGTIF